MYRAIGIKNWIVEEITLKGWWALMVRALPMLISENADFPVLGIEKKTLWTSKEIEIIQFHLNRVHNIDIPEEVLFDSFQESGKLSNKLKDAVNHFNSVAVKLVKSLSF